MIKSIMGSLHLSHLKKQASFFLRGKLKTARLALTDVTEPELMTEEATNSDPWGPETRAMAAISQAAFEIDNYWRIVDILHKRLGVFDTKMPRSISKTLILLEYLLTHGPESVAAEFRSDKNAFHQLAHFQYTDDLGFDWGQSIQRKAERILELLNQEKLLKEERNRARRVSFGIRGSGSFSSKTSSLDEFTRSNSACNHAGEEVSTSYEHGINQAIENKNKNHENELKNGSKSSSNIGSYTNFTVKKEYLCNVKEHDPTIPAPDRGKSPDIKNHSNEYPSNQEWQPFDGSTMSIDKNPLTGHPFPINHQHKGQIAVQDDLSSSKDNATDELNEYDFTPETESEPLLNSSTVEQNPRQIALALGQIHPFDDFENDTTEGLLSHKHKQSPVSIFDIPHSAGRVINI